MRFDRRTVHLSGGFYKSGILRQAPGTSVGGSLPGVFLGWGGSFLGFPKSAANSAQIVIGPGDLTRCHEPGDDINGYCTSPAYPAHVVRCRRREIINAFGAKLNWLTVWPLDLDGAHHFATTTQSGNRVISSLIFCLSLPPLLVAAGVSGVPANEGLLRTWSGPGRFHDMRKGRPENSAAGQSR